MNVGRLFDAGIDGTWGVCVRDASSGGTLVSVQPDEPMAVASVGKLVLLGAIAALAHDGNLDLSTAIRCDTAEPVGDSGILQHLDVDRLSIDDLATLVFACSDNRATNVLLDHVGLDAVRALRPRLRFHTTDLLDRVRDVRTGEHPPTLAIATAGELVETMQAIWRGEFVSPEASGWMLRGLHRSADLSMVPAALRLDPLSHAHGNDTAIANKTGNDIGVRADCGLLTHRGRTVAYAALWNGRPGDEPSAVEAMNSLGRALVDALEGQSGPG